MIAKKKINLSDMSESGHAKYCRLMPQWVDDTVD